jgi:hypothetical protein
MNFKVEPIKQKFFFRGKLLCSGPSICQEEESISTWWFLLLQQQQQQQQQQTNSCTRRDSSSHHKTKITVYKALNYSGH